jgi:hypothetical protein
MFSPPIVYHLCNNPSAFLVFKASHMPSPLRRRNYRSPRLRLGLAFLVLLMVAGSPALAQSQPSLQMHLVTQDQQPLATGTEVCLAGICHMVESTDQRDSETILVFSHVPAGPAQLLVSKDQRLLHNGIVAVPATGTGDLVIVIDPTTVTPVNLDELMARSAHNPSDIPTGSSESTTDWRAIAILVAVVALGSLLAGRVCGRL